MVLKYKFDYCSTSNKFITILDNLLKEKETIYKINREDNLIFLYIEDEEDRLIKISDQLSKELPMSIFLKDFTLEVIPQLPKIDYHFKSDNIRKSYCTNCLTNVENRESSSFYNPFSNCNICGTTCDVNNLEVFEDQKILEYKNYEELFKTLALRLVEGKRVKINDFVFEKLEKLEKENQRLFCVNIENLSNLVVSSKQKSAFLLSLEKPSIDFSVNTIYQSHNNCDVNKVNITLAWDMFLHLLSKELLNLGINFLKYDESEYFDIELKYESNTNRVKIATNEERIFLLENSDYDKKLDDIYEKFDEKSKSQFLVLIDENRLYEKSILNIFLSSKYDDAITLYSPKIDGMLDVLKFKLPENISKVFKIIMEEPSGKKLIDNFQNSFPDAFIDILNFDISGLKENSIFSLWKIASIILGIDDIYEKGSKALLQKGPRIDYKLNESDKIFNKEFDLVKFIKSGISFRLAGVDERTLSLGYVESFSYFLSDLIDEVNENFALDGVSFCGDLIADEFFNKQIKKSLSSNLKLYYNKDFPIQL